MSSFGRSSEADGCGGLARRDANDPDRKSRVEASMAALGELRQLIEVPITRIVSSDAKATAYVVSDVLLPHEPQLVQRGHRQRGGRQVHLLRRW